MCAVQPVVSTGQEHRKSTARTGVGAVETDEGYVVDVAAGASVVADGDAGAVCKDVLTAAARRTAYQDGHLPQGVTDQSLQRTLVSESTGAGAASDTQVCLDVLKPH